MSSFRILRLSAVCLLAPFAAWCTPLAAPYTSESQWLASVSSPTDITFGQFFLHPGDMSDVLPGGSVSADGVTFTGVASPNSLLEVYSPNVNSYYNFNTGDSTPVGFLGSDPAVAIPELSIVVPSNATAIGMYLMSIGSLGTYNININGTVYASPVTQLAPAPVFFGATFSTPITQPIILTMPGISGETEMIADFQFATSGTQQGGSGNGESQAPEAATMIMIGSGLVGLTGLRRRLT